jgi:hypothetical protein
MGDGGGQFSVRGSTVISLYFGDDFELRPEVEAYQKQMEKLYAEGKISRIPEIKGQAGDVLMQKRSERLLLEILEYHGVKIGGAATADQFDEAIKGFQDSEDFKSLKPEEQKIFQDLEARVVARAETDPEDVKRLKQQLVATHQWMNARVEVLKADLKATNFDVDDVKWTPAEVKAKMLELRNPRSPLPDTDKMRLQILQDSDDVMGYFIRSLRRR